jgi:hypothetical protein
LKIVLFFLNISALVCIMQDMYVYIFLDVS